MDLATQKRLYNDCDPYQPLRPDDERNVDVDALGDADHRVRGERWIDVIESHVRLSDRPVRVLFSGLPGSGKSTELLRLQAHLAKPDRCNLLPVIANATDLIDLSVEVDVPDLLIMMLHATERAVLAEEGRSPERAAQEGALTRLWNWLTMTDVTLTEAEFAIPEAGSLTLELKSRDSLRKRVRDVVARNLQSFRKEVVEEFERLQGRARELGRAGIIVIVDSLEKLQGAGERFWEVLDSAWRVFTNDAPYLELPVHTVFTIPSALLRRERFKNVHFLPMIKIADREGRPSQAGIAAARRLIESRMRPEHLREILGSVSLESRVAQLIQWSGGYPREIVHLLRALVLLGGHTVGEGEFQRVLRRQGDEVRRPVPDFAFQWLARVAVEKRLPVDIDEDFKLSERMLAVNVVLRYLNDEEWFDLHPAVRQMPGVVDAIERLRAARAGAEAGRG